MKALIDTNVLLDVLGRRERFYEHSASIWALSERGQLDGLVAAVSFTTVFYLLEKWSGVEAARRGLVLVRDAFAPVACDERILDQAIDSDMADFEDAVRYSSALHAGADRILSRNVGDFPRRPAVPVLSPKEFLAQLD
ncbi:MAG: PIN domain-containing protein [Candidatus Brocadiia bacterium]